MFNILPSSEEQNNSVDKKNIYLPIMHKRNFSENSDYLIKNL